MAVIMPPGFEARAVLGKGAMGIVYKCWQPKLKRFVAIKTCNIRESVDAGQDPARLEDEALTIARLNHPNIVSLIDVFSDDKNIYLIMEYLEGPPISRFLNRKADPQKLGSLVDMLDLSFSRIFKDEAACKVGIAVARALEYAHSRKILHRDVKPANIVITLDRHIKLLDFSIARDPQQEKESRTITGTVFGTVQYMSPEQILSNPLDGRTDVYALGCSLYHMVSGEVPFSDRNDINVCLSHVNDPPPDMLSLNPLIRPELMEIILKCMEKKPENRYGTAAELAEALEEALAAMTRGGSAAGETGDAFEISLSTGASEDPVDNRQYTPIEEELPEEPAEIPAETPPPESPSSSHNDVEESDDAEASGTREKRRRELREIAAASDTNVPDLTRVASATRAETQRASATATPWIETSYTPPPTSTIGENDPTPRPTRDSTTTAILENKTLLLSAIILLMVILVVVIVVAFGGSGDETVSPPSQDDNIAAAITPTSARTPEPTPAPRATPSPTPPATPSPVPTRTPVPLPVPSHPEVDPAIRTYHVPLGSGNSLTMVEVPPGTFLMGSPPDEPGRAEDEGPVTRVTFNLPFFVSNTEVTWGVWREVMGDRTTAGEADEPVVNITWEEADEFCRRLTSSTGISFSLPTEAQWEYACRATMSSPFTFGDIVTSRLCNIDGTITYYRAPSSNYRGKLVKAMELPPNRWGLYNVHGNVWEMTQDSYVPRLPGSDLIDPGPMTSGVDVVLRGGGFRSDAGNARSATRRRAPKTERSRDVGFRVVAGL